MKLLIAFVLMVSVAFGVSDVKPKPADGEVSAKIVDMPPRAVLSTYEIWSGQKLVIPEAIRSLDTPVTVRIEKEMKPDALIKIERALREQAGIEIVRSSDGVLTARKNASAK